MATRKSFSSFWTQIGTRLLPFADAASDELPLPRLLRLSLFQVSVGMTMVLLTGTLNRVMIVELGLAASVVSMMVALPLLFAPFRAFLGHKSDTHRSALGWKRGPYIWFGSLLLFGGFAIMPFALLLLSGDTTGPFWIGQIGAALAFLLVGAGMHTVQTAGLALAADLAPAEDHPRVVALLFVMLLIGMVFSALIFGILLRPFSQLTLIQMIQGTAVTVMVLNLIALWKQEPRTPKDKQDLKERPSFADAWRKLVARPGTRRLLAATGVGAAAFSMQDVLLEPYGGEILGMSVSGTTLLTAVLAAFTLIGFAFSAWRLTHHAEPNRLAAMGLLVGIIGFSGVIFSGPLSSTVLFVCGVALIGMGSGVFSVCVLTSVMTVIEGQNSGIALGAWGAVQATSIGVGVAVGGAIRDGVIRFSDNGLLGEAFATPSAGYTAVYHIEIILLFVGLAIIGPLAKFSGGHSRQSRGARFSLPVFPQ